MKLYIDRIAISALLAFSRLRATERGASMVEYCLMVALIFLVCIGAVGFFGSKPQVPLSSAGSTLAQ